MYDWKRSIAQKREHVVDATEARRVEIAIALERLDPAARPRT